MRGALANGDLGGARGIVEGVWGCWVEVCVLGAKAAGVSDSSSGGGMRRGYVHSHIEEHAVCFSVAEALAFGISFAEGAAGVEGILCAA